MDYVLVFIKGGLGSALRHGVHVLAARFWGTQYPIGTLSINVLGSFAMGVVVEYLAMSAATYCVSRKSLSYSFGRKQLFKLLRRTDHGAIISL